MSDEQRDRAEEERADEDVEAHGFDAPEGMDDVEAHGFTAPIDAPIDAPHANEEPPDVEGHHMGRPIDPRPVDSPVD